MDYFAAIHPNAHVDRLFGVLYFLPNLSTIPFVLRFAHLAAPARLRVRFGFGVFLACLLVPAAAPRSLAALCAAVALTGVADAFAQGSLFGVVAQMPPAYTQALMGGTSFSGVVVSALRLVAKAASASDSVAGLRRGAVAYFAVAATWVASCLVAHGALERTEAYARSAAGEEGFRASDASGSTFGRAALEIDGFSFSSSPSAWDRDRGTRRGRRVDPSRESRRRLWGRLPRRSRRSVLRRVGDRVLRGDAIPRFLAGASRPGLDPCFSPPSTSPTLSEDAPGRATRLRGDARGEPGTTALCLSRVLFVGVRFGAEGRRRRGRGGVRAAARRHPRTPATMVADRGGPEKTRGVRDGHSPCSSDSPSARVRMAGY